MNGIDGDGASWGPLVRHLLEDAPEADFVPSVLARFRQATGVRSVALYLNQDSMLQLELCDGDGELPEVLTGAPPDGFGVFKLPDGLLLFEPGAGPGLDGLGSSPLAALLALAARICCLKRQLKRQNFAAGMRGVEQQALYDVGLAITSMLDVESLSEAILSWALSLLDARRAALYLLEGGVYGLSRALGGSALPSFSTAEALLLPAGVLPGATHLLAAAIKIEGSPRGMLVVADKESRRGVGPFGATDDLTLQLFANQAAIALENARLHRQALEKERLEREMELAAEIQRQILPEHAPDIPGYELAGWNRPARHIGGDYYNYLRTAEGRWVLTLGDVSGKGMPAALMVSILHSALRLMLDRHEVGPTLFERLNHHVLDSSAPAKYITLLVAELDPATRRLGYVNAGHNPGVVLDLAGNVRQLPSTGLPVGLLPGGSFQRSSVELAPGDLVCLYSDGLTEAANRAGDEFGLGRLIDCLAASREQSLEAIIRSLDEATTRFAGGQPQGDDQTVVLLRVMPAA